MATRLQRRRSRHQPHLSARRPLHADLREPRSRSSRRSGPRSGSPSSNLGQSDDHGRRGGRNYVPSGAVLHHAMGRDRNGRTAAAAGTVAGGMGRGPRGALKVRPARAKATLKQKGGSPPRRSRTTSTSYTGSSPMQSSAGGCPEPCGAGRPTARMPREQPPASVPAVGWPRSRGWDVWR